MALVEMVMPKMGESIMEGTILSWLKQVGDEIEQDESVLEVATDKVDTEIPSTHAGVLKEILAKEGDVVAVGKPIAVLETKGETENPVDVPESTLAEEEPSPVELATAIVDEAVAAHGSIKANGGPNTIGSRFYSPLVLNIAKEEQVPMSELETIPGSGKDNRVTKKDILAYVKKRKEGKVAVAPTTNGTHKVASSDAPISVSGEDEIIQMDRMRKMIAERMVASKQISAHVTSFVEADVTNIVSWRNKMKHAFIEREGQTLTYTPIFIEAVIKAIKDYPMVNIQIDGDKIVKKSSINIGLAVALPSGNLIVPVIQKADQLNITGLTRQVNDLARRARDNKLKADELTGGTYTVSNVGSFGNVMGTPIIMQPQVAILALGAVMKKPSVIETPDGDFIGIRHKMFLSHSYDHRVIDGALGGMFVRRVADYLEKFDIDRTV